MTRIHTLFAAAEAMRRLAGAPGAPGLLVFTDPVRGLRPLEAAALLPRGAGLVYRHFGADDRQEIAYSLRRACWRRGAKLLIGADPALARAVGADGVHWPERLVAGRMGRQRQFRIETAAAHGVGGLLKAEAAGMDAVVLSPVFASDSPSAGAAFGLWRGSALARRAKLPVLALGGVDSDKSRALRVSGFAGFALVTGFAAAA